MGIFGLRPSKPVRAWIPTEEWTAPVNGRSPSPACPDGACAQSWWGPSVSPATPSEPESRCRTRGRADDGDPWGFRGPIGGR
jgi:hypothetical protein